MKATVLVDNIAAEDIKSEWGLSFFIEYQGHKILLDAGGSELFAENAKKLGLSLAEVEYAALSHAHYDHGNGMIRFFAENDKAKFHLRRGTGENCYGKRWIFRKYIGIPRRVMTDYAQRIELVEGDYPLCPGVTLVPHKTPGLENIGKREAMYLREGRKWYPDDFRHEQSLVFETERGLVIFNSCSHGGADNIIKEVQSTFPGKKIYAIIGGFHLYNKTEEEVLAFARRVQECDVEQIYTGHCTGKKAYGLLQGVLGDKLHQLHSGLVMEF